MDVRQIRGYSILAKGDNPIMVNKETFLVPSQSSDKKYKVTHLDGWTCECKDFKLNKQICKHIHSIRFWLKIRDGIGSNELMELEKDIENGKCVFCESTKIVKNGSRKTKAGIRQRYLCKDCGKRFVTDPIKYIKGNGKIVALVMDLYFKGLSLRDIADTVYQFYDLKLHHETIRKWILKFTKKMNDYTEKLQPKVSGVWHTDEQMIRSKGKQMWSWNVLDDETRFLIANTVTKERDIKDARKVFEKARLTAKGRPEIMITDGLPAYKKAFKREFWTTKKPRSKHIMLVGLKNRIHNNRVERYHGTFRERDKVMRGFKGKEKEITEAFRTYYNFIRPHMALDGLTPSQMADLDLNLGRNRWLSLLKLSIK